MKTPETCGHLGMIPGIPIIQRRHFSIGKSRFFDGWPSTNIGIYIYICRWVNNSLTMAHRVSRVKSPFLMVKSPFSLAASRILCVSLPMQWLAFQPPTPFWRPCRTPNPPKPRKPYAAVRPLVNGRPSPNWWEISMVLHKIWSQRGVELVAVG